MSTSPEGREEAVSRAFVTLADSLVDEYDVVELLAQLATFCVELLPVDAAGIVLGDARRELRAVAASEEDARLMELLELQNDEGPCLDCFQSSARVDATDLAQAAPRWPAWSAAVRQRTDYRSVHALPLRLRGQAIGALNLFSRVPAGLSEADLALAQALADVATIGILQERAIRRGEVLTEQLQGALNSRLIIEQAKGALAEHTGRTPDAAFEIMRGFARSHNMRLAHVARRIVTKDISAQTLLDNQQLPNPAR